MRGFPMTKFLKVSVMLEKDAAYADARKWSDHQHHLTGKRVSYILSQAINSGLLVTTDEAARLYTQFNSQNFKVQDAGGAIRHLRQTLASEMQHLTYFEVTRDRAPFYSNPEPFGPKVAKKYHKASYDIEQASRCYALDRYTATVFHLMRAMEVSVRALARKLKVTFDPRTASWGEVLRLIDTAMKALPRATVKEQALKDKCAEAYTLLFHVKNVWRNETMHPKKKYDDTEAIEIFNAVKSFMNYMLKVT